MRKRDLDLGGALRQILRGWRRLRGRRRGRRGGGGGAGSASWRILSNAMYCQGVDKDVFSTTLHQQKKIFLAWVLQKQFMVGFQLLGSLAHRLDWIDGSLETKGIKEFGLFACFVYNLPGFRQKHIMRQSFDWWEERFVLFCVSQTENVAILCSHLLT